MKLIRSKKFIRKYSKIFRKQHGLITKIDITLRIISLNPFDETLRTHKLSGNLKSVIETSKTQANAE